MSTQRLIDKYGVPITITTKYIVQNDLNIGDTSIVLDNVLGLDPGHDLALGAEVVVIDSVDTVTNTAQIREPLIYSHITGSQAVNVANVNGVSVTRNKSITRDELEYIRRVRISDQVLVNYGSTVDHEKKKFFVSGIDHSDMSKLLKINEYNGIATLKTEGDGEFNGFSYDENLIDKATNIPAYFLHISSRMEMRDGAGYVPSTYVNCTISPEYDPAIGDILVTEGLVYKVIGIDKFKIKNMITLILDFDATRN